jgi:excisionase family DNA binding protein
MLAIQERLLRVPDFADRLGLRVSTVRSWVLHRRIRVVRVSKRAIRIPESEADKIIEAGTIPARS